MKPKTILKYREFIACIAFALCWLFMALFSGEVSHLVSANIFIAASFIIGARYETKD